MPLNFYEWPELVDYEYANQIVYATSNDTSADGVWGGYSKTMFGQSEDEAEGVRVAVLSDEGNAVGYALYTRSEFKEIYVLEEHRGGGYADVILKAVKEWYQSEGIEDVDVTIAISDQARRFWESRAIHGGTSGSKLKLDNF